MGKNVTVVLERSNIMQSTKSYEGIYRLWYCIHANMMTQQSCFTGFSLCMK